MIQIGLDYREGKMVIRALKKMRAQKFPKGLVSLIAKFEKAFDDAEEEAMLQTEENIL